MSVAWLRAPAQPGRTLLLALLAGCLAACGVPDDRSPQRPSSVPASRFEQRDVAIDGMRLRYVDIPALHAVAGALPLVLIHGHTSRIEEYDDLATQLLPDHRVIILDLPGSGYSDKPVRDYDLIFYENTILAFLDRLGVGRANLAGGSQGGNLTLRLGHRAPERFERLSAWAPAGAWDGRPWAARVIRATSSYALFWPIVKIQSRYWYRDDFPLRQTFLQRTFAYYDEVMGEGFVRMYFGMAADQVEHSLFGFAPEIRQPTLLMWGDQDHGANMGEGVRRLHDLLPNDELRIFQNAGHALANEIPAPLASAIREFLARPIAQP